MYDIYYVQYPYSTPVRSLSGGGIAGVDVSLSDIIAVLTDCFICDAGSALLCFAMTSVVVPYSLSATYLVLGMGRTVDGEDILSDL